MDRQFDILIYGELCSNDLILAEYLARKGLNVRVATFSDNRRAISVPNIYFTNFEISKNVIHMNITKDKKKFINLIRDARLVVTFTGSLGFTLFWVWPLKKFFRFPPIINVVTGSDFSELLDENSRAGFFLRYSAKNIYDYNIIPSYPHILKNVLKYQIKNVLFFRGPFYVLPLSSKTVKKNENEKLRFFHASNLDFRVNDPGINRNSSKGNDRFLKAFFRALDEGLDAECVILDRGPDRQVARAMIESTKFASRFVWKSHLSREELFREFEWADVIVDQFDVGGLGGIALEAMAMAKPVLIYVQEKCMNILYSEQPPVLNAYTEEDIFKQVISCRDRNNLIRIGSEAQRWVYQNHSWETCIEQFLFYYSLLTGHKVVDYGWHKKSIYERNELK